jgi:magnesium chelatase subunit I
VVPFPFSAIVGQEQLKLALQLVVVDPGLGGVLVFGDRGTAKSTAVRALASLLPRMRVVEGCPYQCDPSADGASCGSGCTASSRRKEGAVTEAPVPVVDLPLGATEDRVVGALDLEAALRGVSGPLPRGSSRERTAASSTSTR